MKFGGTHETSQEIGDMRHPSVRGEDQERHFEFSQPAKPLSF
jgi:hypothetical protein